MKLQKKEILEFLDRINRDIEEFLRSSIEQPALAATKDWSNLRGEFGQLRCRDVKGCSRKDCPAYESGDYKCWLVAGTLCGSNGAPADFGGKFKNRFACEVFQIISEDPLRRLYENIDILIYHMHDRAGKFRKLAHIDHLTGLYNRHFFNETIEREMSRAERKSEVISFVMVDIDNFKDANDTLGHLTGDKLLIETGALLSGATRKEDLVFRFGGDEFLVLMTNADCTETDRVVARLYKIVGQWNARNARNVGWTLSLSAGCATCEQGCDIHAALNAADKKMYEAKNRKKLEQPGPPDDQKGT